MDNIYSVKLSRLIEELNLETIWVPDGYENIPITTEDVNRPGLQLAGFFDYFDPRRIQIVGQVEKTYLEGLTSAERLKRFDMLLSKDIPVLVIARGLEPFEECIEMSKKYGVPLLRTQETTSHIAGVIVMRLKMHLAPRITRHGVLVDVYGEGLLLLGESGVGKSETAIELVKRGHRLIADDAVEIKKVSDKKLVGSAPELIRHYVEIRGIGVIDVRRLFGMGAIKGAVGIDLLINIEHWKEGIMYDRLGVDNLYTTILDVKIPALTIPVTPGRNLAVILEVAAMNNRNKKMGYNAAMEFTEQINRHFDSVLSDMDEFID